MLAIQSTECLLNGDWNANNIHLPSPFSRHLATIQSPFSWLNGEKSENIQRDMKHIYKHGILYKLKEKTYCYIILFYALIHSFLSWMVDAWSANSEYIWKMLFNATTLRTSRPIRRSLISVFWARMHEISRSVILNRNNFGSKRAH